MKRSLIWSLPLLAGLWGCDSLSPDSQALAAPANGPQDRPRCDACHGYAPHTGGHRYHLDTAFQVSYRVSSYGTSRRSTTRQITCANCHAASIAFQANPVRDTIYRASTGHADRHTSGWPWMPFNRATAGTFDTATLDSVPIPASTREAGMENPFWVTQSSNVPGAPGHANGAVDVVFPERDAYWTDPQDGRTYKATWDPIRMSCAAVACHGSQSLDGELYTWKSQ